MASFDYVDPRSGNWYVVEYDAGAFLKCDLHPGGTIGTNPVEIRTLGELPKNVQVVIQKKMLLLRD
jgi:hypothetical protein